MTTNKIASGRDFGSAIERTYRKADGSADITPGMLLEITGVDDDGVPLVAPQSGDAVNVSTRIAMAKATGNTTPRESPIDENYTEDADEVRAYVLRPGEGDQNGLGNADIAEGDAIVADGTNAGHFRSFDGAGGDVEGAKLGIALEAVAQTGDRFEYEVI